jgi:hypothetical protein
LLFSEQQDIVNSEIWLNLIPENGLDGTPKGNTLSEETRRKISVGNMGKIVTLETKIKQSKAQIGRVGPNKGRSPNEEWRQKISIANLKVVHTEEWSNNISIALKGKPKSKEHREAMSAVRLGKIKGPQKQLTCYVCGFTGGATGMTIYHFENCGKDRSFPIIQCPYCEISGGGSNMKRWHFENCKHNPNKPKE